MSGVVIFDEQTFYIDFINYYHDNVESYDISEVFSWYFDERIYNNTEKYNQLHFFGLFEFQIF